jgi:hypothetical protein
MAGKANRKLVGQELRSLVFHVHGCILYSIIAYSQELMASNCSLRELELRIKNASHEIAILSAREIHGFKPQ